MLSVILLLTLSVPGTLGYFLSFDSGESCEANGCTTPSSAAECEEATVAAGTSHSTLPDGTRFRTWTFGSGARCNIQYMTYDGITSYAVTWATTGTLYSIGCSFNTRVVCKCQYPPPGPASPPPVSPPEAVMHPGPDGTFFVHGVYQASAGVVVDGEYQAFAGKFAGYVFAPPEGCIGTDFYHLECVYNGQVDCKHTCGLYGARAVGARPMCNRLTSCGRYGWHRSNECPCELNGVSVAGTYGDMMVNINGATWSASAGGPYSPFGRAYAETIGVPKSSDPFITDIIGSTPETFPILFDGSPDFSIECQCEAAEPVAPSSASVSSDCLGLQPAQA